MTKHPHDTDFPLANLSSWCLHGRKHQIGELCASTRCFDDLVDERCPMLPRHLATSVDVPRHPLPQCSGLRSWRLGDSKLFDSTSHQIPPFYNSHFPEYTRMLFLTANKFSSRETLFIFWHASAAIGFMSLQCLSCKGSLYQNWLGLSKPAVNVGCLQLTGLFSSSFHL